MNALLRRPSDLNCFRSSTISSPSRYTCPIPRCTSRTCARGEEGTDQSGRRKMPSDRTPVDNKHDPHNWLLQIQAWLLVYGVRVQFADVNNHINGTRPPLQVAQVSPDSSGTKYWWPSFAGASRTFRTRHTWCGSSQSTPRRISL